MPLPHAELAEATRLTRAGRLDEATALIQRALRGASGASTAAAAPRRPALTGPALAGPDAAAAVGPRPLRGHPFAFGGPPRGAAPPPAPPEGARFETRLHRGEAGAREYRLYIPASRPAGPVPLVVMLHGCTQTPDDFAAGTRMNAWAERRGVLVAYPAQPPSANAQRCWNWFSPGDQRRGAGEPAILAGLAREVARREGGDPRRVFVAGLSAGGAAAAVLGQTYPEVFAAVGVHSGLACGAARDVPSAFAAMKGQGGDGGWGGRAVRAIVFHADRDTTVHPVNGDRVAAQALGGGAGGGLRRDTERGQAPGGGRRWTRTRHLDAAGRAVLEQWVVEGAGHAWSGGSPDGSHTDPLGPDASREMLRFFLEGDD